MGEAEQGDPAGWPGEGSTVLIPHGTFSTAYGLVPVCLLLLVSGGMGESTQSLSV